MSRECSQRRQQGGLTVQSRINPVLPPQPRSAIPSRNQLLPSKFLTRTGVVRGSNESLAADDGRGGTWHLILGVVKGVALPPELAITATSNRFVAFSTLKGVIDAAYPIDQGSLMWTCDIATASQPFR